MDKFGKGKIDIDFAIRGRVSFQRIYCANRPESPAAYG